MATDWRDALKALKGEMTDIPEANDNTPESQDDSEGKSQKEPLHIVLDKKGRNGKIATIIEGFTIDQSEVESIAKRLKQKLGVGGSVREGEILIQGNHLENVKNYLHELNFKTK